jgi:hypothetical protein
MVISVNNGKVDTGWYNTSPTLLGDPYSETSVSVDVGIVFEFVRGCTGIVVVVSAVVILLEEMMVIQSVVGMDPVFNNFDPIKALMRVDFPALYSPAMTMTNVL